MSITKATRFPITVRALPWLSAPVRVEVLVGNELSPQLAVFEDLGCGAVHSSRVRSHDGKRRLVELAVSLALKEAFR